MSNASISMLPDESLPLIERNATNAECIFNVRKLTETADNIVPLNRHSMDKESRTYAVWLVGGITQIKARK